MKKKVSNFRNNNKFHGFFQNLKQKIRVESMSKQHIYSKEPFNSTHGIFQTGGSSYDARSGLHSFPSVKYGEIPNGDYTLSSISNTGGIERYNLTPQQDIGSRSYLQIHQKSQNPIKNYLGLDTKGCIVVDSDAMPNMKIGDTLNVQTRKPSFSNPSDVMNSIVLHNNVFETIDYDPKDWFDDVPK